MPQYDYRCDICNEMQTIQRSIHDDAISPTCCDTEMKQVYSVFGLKFNGTGFYSTGG